MEEEVKRSVGRPRLDATNLKKGRTSWKPASVTDVTGKEPGYRYRWSRKEPDNLYKKESEGWETVSGLMGDGVKPVDTHRLSDGKNLSSVYEKHDVILQRIPEDIAKERDEYFNNESARRVAGLTAHVKKDLAKEGAATHGEITISSRREAN